LTRRMRRVNGRIHGTSRMELPDIRSGNNATSGEPPESAVSPPAAHPCKYPANALGTASKVACAQRPLRSAEARRRSSPERIWKTLLQRASPVQFAVFQLFRA
jgi:hypothetical protein